ncbi:MAG: flagellar basal body P-ring formation chaperone FlgA [Pseudomonadota bacterium]
MTVTNMNMGLAKRIACLLLALVPMLAGARQEPAEVKRVVEDFLRIQTKGLPGAVSFTVGTIDPNNNLAPCPALEAFSNAGSRPWGRTSVGVRCLVEGGWTLYVPVQVKVVGDYLVTARALPRGHMVSAADLVARRGDLAELPAGVVTDPAQAVGKTLLVGLGSGQLLRSDALRARFVVQQGQTVKVLSRGQGFQVATEGRALNNAAEGQVVQVRTASGQTVSGIARAGGAVEVSY